MGIFLAVTLMVTAPVLAADESFFDRLDLIGWVIGWLDLVAEPVLRKSFEKHGFEKRLRQSAPGRPEISEEGQAAGGAFLIGLRGHVFEIGPDYHLGRPATGYSARGGGAGPALGAFHGMEEPPGR